MSLASTDLTRGLRNNNPGNMDFNLHNHPWQGEIRPSQDPRFCQFDTMENGVRALAKQLLIYHERHSCNTVAQVINRWAPPVENITSAYVTDVAAFCYAGPDDLYDFKHGAPLGRLVRGIINHENGKATSEQYVSSAVLALGVQAAMS